MNCYNCHKKKARIIWEDTPHPKPIGLPKVEKKTKKTAEVLVESVGSPLKAIRQLRFICRCYRASNESAVVLALGTL